MVAKKGKTYNVGIYERLSKDDELLGESASIQHQRKILLAHVKENGFNLVEEYVDDGWSGTNFNRPGFIRMISDIEAGRINCVITKDLSRLGRNYLEVGHYIENFFPSHGVRFIAIGDNIDTDKGDSDLVPFMNIFNEFHAKQTSKKLRQVHEMQCEEGDCHYTYPPMGYNKSEENRKRLTPDKETAWIVEKIFQLADEEGMGAYSIQGWLMENKVINPGYREYVRWGAKSRIYDNCPEERKYYWDLATIKRLLKNQVYIGHTVRYKSRTVSYKNRTRIKYDMDSWSIKENTHPALISKERFDRVQKQMESRRRKNKDGEVQIFSGVARCADCGGYMRFSTNRQTPGAEYQYLSCGNRSGNSVAMKKCTLHYMRYDTLKGIVLQRIQELFAMVSIDRHALASKLSNMDNENSEVALKKDREEHNRLETRKSEVEKLLIRVYEDWASGRITEQMFTVMSGRYQQEQIEVSEKLSELKSKLDRSREEAKSIEKWLSVIESIEYPVEVTRELVSALIDRIDIHEAIGPKGSRKKKQIVEIHWKFADSSK